MAQTPSPCLNLRLSDQTPNLNRNPNRNPNQSPNLNRNLNPNLNPNQSPNRSRTPRQSLSLSLSLSQNLSQNLSQSQKCSICPSLGPWLMTLKETTTESMAFRRFRSKQPSICRFITMVPSNTQQFQAARNC